MPVKLSIENFFSQQFRNKLGRITLYIAIISFLVHLAIYFVSYYVLNFQTGKLLLSPINAIYTPFSFLLVYEAYLLLFYLPQSTTIYIGKQYEIITLILIRGIFKDITHLNLSNINNNITSYSELWYDLVTVIILFVSIFLFYKISNRFNSSYLQDIKDRTQPFEIQQFILAKKYLSIVLLIISLVLSIYAFTHWGLQLFSSNYIDPGLDINSIFFDHFFSLLIIGDVLLLLFSLFYTDDYPLIIRNSSFVISTILLKLSFSSTGIMERIFIIVGVIFGVVMYAISTLYIRKVKS